MDMIHDLLPGLHFLRPQWFYAFVPLGLYLVLLIKGMRNTENWNKICDAPLRPYVLTTRQGKHSILPVILTLIGAGLCITALAGPVFKKLPQPVFREQSALVILLDMSQSMNATDIKPSRIERAKLELLDILKQRKGGQSALIVYAADAFTVTPLTDDNETLANLLPSLETEMMPAQGSNLDLALSKAYELLTQAGITHGDILIVTDDIHVKDSKAIEKIHAQGHRVSIFGTGTAQGSPVPLSNGFLQDESGAIVVPKLDATKLGNMALKGGGIYIGVSADDSDTQTLSRLFSAHRNNSGNKSEKAEADIRADSWREDGVWLVLPLLFFASLWARKGWLAIVLVFLLPLPQPGFAADTNADLNKADTTPLLSMDNLWLTPDQKAMQAFKHGDTDQAARTFRNKKWKASALYRSGKYKEAAQLFEPENNTDKRVSGRSGPATSSDDFYNKGNSLAKSGQLKQAIEAYDKALELDKSNEDAKFNRDIVKKALEKQQQKQNQQSGDKSDQNKQDKDSEKKDDQNKDSKDGSKDQDQKKKENKDKDKQQQNDKKQGSDQQQQDQQKSDQQNQDKQQSEKSQQNDQQQSDSDKKDKNRQQDQQQKNAADNKDKQQQQDEAMKRRNPDDAQTKKEQKEQEEIKRAEEEQNKDKNRSENDQDNQQPEKDKKPLQVKEINPRDASITEDQKATEQWLRRVPDDPGGLLRRKFLYQYKQIPNQHNSDQPW